MSTKKLVIIIATIVGGLILVVTLLAGAIVGGAFYAIGNSEAARAAKEFLRQSEKLKQDIGEVKDFGYLVTGSIKTGGGDGNASLHLKVIGERRDAQASVYLMYKQGHKWRVTDAEYRSEAGQTVNLMNKHESETPEREPEDER
jgi:hypothetical protein